MAAPTNTTAATAVVISSLPYSVTQNVHDAGTTYSVWYSWTATFTGTVGLWGFGDVATYRPTTFIYITNPAGAAFNQYQNRPMYFSVTQGTEYFFRFVTNGGNPSPASLAVSLIQHQTQAVPAGSIGINDVQSGYPVALLDIDTDYTVLRYVTGVTNGEYGAATLPNGVVMLGGGSTGLFVYDSTYALVGTASPAKNCYWITSNQVDAFYAASGWPFGTGNDTVYKLNATGSLTGDAWTVDVGDVRGIAVSPNESILYYIAQFDTDTDKPVRKWDLINDVVLPDLAAGIDADTYFTSNLLCLSDGSVFVGYRNDTAHTQFVRQYSAAGAVIRTFTLTWQASTGQQDLLARDLNENTFWYWQHGDSTINAASIFTQFTVATGAVARTRLGAQFDAGRYAYSETATPLARFGNPYSCPFWIQQAGTPPIPPDNDLNGPGGLDILRAQGKLVVSPIRRVRITPHVFDKNQRIFTRRLELLTAPGKATVTGQGEDPVIALHVSNDGGETYPVQRTLTTGRLGAYTHRCYTHQLGAPRDRVYKFISTDPVTSVWIDVDVDVDEGLS